jgi:hypothetical protein
MALSGTTLFVGGQFSSAGGETRKHIAALDISDGALKAWNPDADDTVSCLLLSGSTLYAGGEFTGIGGQARNHLAALDTATGKATAWNPGPDDAVKAMALSGTTLYLGGAFTGIGGKTRNRIGAVDILTGAVSDWDPFADNTVNALALSGTTLYAGGLFTSIGGQARSGLAALDTTLNTNCATAWNPAADPPHVNTMLRADSTLYVGGRFESMGGETRGYIAAVDIATGNVSSWNPDAAGGGFAKGINCMALADGTLYAGGDYSEIGGEARACLAALDTTTGNATLWDPDFSGAGLYPGVHCMFLADSALYVAGGFFNVGGVPRHGIAAFNFVPPATTADPQGGTYDEAQSVVLTCTDSSGTGCAATYYTTDGTTPTTASAVYSDPVAVSDDTTLKFFSRDTEGTSEPVHTETYVISPAAPPEDDDSGGPAPSGGGGGGGGCFITAGSEGY